MSRRQETVKELEEDWTFSLMHRLCPLCCCCWVSSTEQKTTRLGSILCATGEEGPAAVIIPDSRPGVLVMRLPDQSRVAEDEGRVCVCAHAHACVCLNTSLRECAGRAEGCVRVCVLMGGGFFIGVLSLLGNISRNKPYLQEVRMKVGQT